MIIKPETKNGESFLLTQVSGGGSECLCVRCGVCGGAVIMTRSRTKNSTEFSDCGGLNPWMY